MNCSFVSLSLLLAVTSGCAAHRGWYAVSDANASAPALLELSPQVACPEHRGSGPVVVLVHGIGGETANVSEVREVLGGLDPAALLSFHWSPMEESGPLVARFADGLSGLARCALSRRPVIIVAHSAGGVLASLAASRVNVGGWEERHDLVVLTVASPLGGAGYSSWRMRLLPVKPFALTVGGKFERYAAPAKGVRVVHLRTHPTGDHVMRPTSAGHRPDHPDAVVPGAAVHALPEDVGHDDALLWAARALVAEPHTFGLSPAVAD